MWGIVPAAIIAAQHAIKVKSKLEFQLGHIPAIRAARLFLNETESDKMIRYLKRTNYSDLFKNPEDLYDSEKLWSHGWTYNELAEYENKRR